MDSKLYSPSLGYAGSGGDNPVSALKPGSIVDRFAADHNAVVERFNARFDTPNAEAVDAFAQYWGADFNFVLGDFNKIDRVLDIVERDDAEGVIIVPERPREIFWRRIWSAAWQRRVERWEYLGGDELAANAENAEQCFFGERFNGRLLVMLVRRLGGGGGGDHGNATAAPLGARGGDRETAPSNAPSDSTAPRNG